MRFVRIQADIDVPPTGLAELTAGADLDLLQLDYARPRATALTGPGAASLPEFAPAFETALHAVQKLLYLEPRMCVVSSAGWSSSYACVERAASVLRSAGCGELAISAVRGSNLEPILDHLFDHGVKLENIESGAPWRELRGHILAADLHLGAGPLAAALAEGARVVVAGSYDVASPATAAAVQAFSWGWDAWDQLAGAAMAARAAAWSTWPFSLGSAHPCVELDAQGVATVALGRAANANDGTKLTEWLRQSADSDGRQAHADVQCNASNMSAAPSGPQQLQLSGASGAKHDGQWRLDVLYQVGFLAEVLVELLPESATARRRLVEGFKSQFVDVERSHASVRVQELACQAAAEPGPGWLHLDFRSRAAGECQRFVDQLSAFAAANADMVRLPAGRPEVLVDTALWPTKVPSDAVDIAVDTRPAHDWE